MCASHLILGPEGRLPSEQPNLESIRLVTDSRCGWNYARRDYRLALTAFPHLKRLSWIGVASEVDRETLADVLEQRSHQLTHLDIKLDTAWELGRRSRSDDSNSGLPRGELGSEILRLPGRGHARFPALEWLALEDGRPAGPARDPGVG